MAVSHTATVTIFDFSRRLFLSAFWLAVSLYLFSPPAAAVECAGFEYQSIHATVCRVNVRSDRLRIFLDDESGRPLKSFTHLERLLESRGQRLLFAMNAGMYHTDYSPVGLLVADGREIHPLNLAGGRGNFFLKPNGVFVLSASGAKVVASSQYPSHEKSAILATQSGPLLLLDGQPHPALLPQSRSRFIRNGVGVITPEQVVFVISDEPVNFYHFALLFRDGLGCQNALYLDGNVSSLFAADLQRRDHHAALGPIIAVTVASGQPLRRPTDGAAEPSFEEAEYEASLSLTLK